jgi:hypothetical protein
MRVHTVLWVQALLLVVVGCGVRTAVSPEADTNFSGAAPDGGPHGP